jgi:hypothetical protein
MKNLIKNCFAIVPFYKTIFLLLLGLASCKNDDVIAPDQQVDSGNSNLRTSAIPATLSRLQLARYGNDFLTYLPDGRLDHVTTSTPRGGGSVYKKYEYTEKSILISTYTNGAFSRLVICAINPATGYCTNVQQADYSLINDKVNVVEEEFVYKYNAKGQLVNRFNINATSFGTNYIYAPNGDLSSVQNYTGGYGTAGPKVRNGANLYYDQPNSPVLENLYPINPEEADLPDPYLKIFGKPCKHLVKLASYLKSQDGKVYSYKTDADGYVQSIESKQLVGGALIDTKICNYKLVDIGLSL